MSKKTKIGSCQSLYWSGFSYEPMSVEVDISRGLFCFNVVGLADKTMSESKHRILPALKNCEFDLPQRKNEKVVVSLLPANKKKEGTYADLAIVFSYLLGSRQIPNFKKDNMICCIGEVRLEGSVMVKQDIVHMLHAGIKAGMKKFIVPKGSTKHFNLLPNIEVMEIDSLNDFKKPLVFIKSEDLAVKTRGESIEARSESDQEEYHGEKFKIDQLIGLENQKRALMIGLAGNHHILFSGLPGTGKSALADSADELIDNLTGPEAIETYAIHQAVKFSGNIQVYDLTFRRPIRRPHASIQAPGLIGDGSNQPGELSLAHNGLIILNELCEFDKKALEALRDPIENQRLLVHKHGVGINFKLHMTVIATTNLCPCGKIPLHLFANDEIASDPKNKDKTCNCTNYQIYRYQYKISEPFIDRFPITCTFSYDNGASVQTDYEELSGREIKKRIADARALQRRRNDNLYNQYLTPLQVMQFGVSEEAKVYIENMEKIFDLSKRKIAHMLRVARTIADLENAKEIAERHLFEAASYVKKKPF